uniref:Uncharacterized protein n=1 Tax=Oryza brachyantha TaxID=4533 RepID=J3ND08_ORYBR
MANTATEIVELDEATGLGVAPMMARVSRTAGLGDTTGVRAKGTCPGAATSPDPLPTNLAKRTVAVAAAPLPSVATASGGLPVTTIAVSKKTAPNLAMALQMSTVSKALQMQL